MPFLLDGNPTSSEISEAVNYLLSNFSQSVVADPATGQIIGPSGEVTGYLYKYMFVKYADSFDGTVNFSNSPTGRLYYGTRNSDDPTESTNPSDYIWTQVTGGFGSTKYLWYIVTGGRQIGFQVSTSLPNPGWVQDTGAAIDLDYVTTVSNTPANFVVIRVANDSSAPTNAEVLAAIGRDPIDGDLCIVNYNSGIYSLQYKYTSGWAIFQKVITGDLVVASSIVGSNIAGNTITASNMVTGTITAASGILADAVITTAKIADLNVETAKIAGNAVTSSASATGTTSIAVTAPSGASVVVFCQARSTGTFYTSVAPNYWATCTISKNGSSLRTFRMPIAWESTNFSSVILSDATVVAYDTGTGSSVTYSASTSTISSYDWTVFIFKK